MAEKKTFLPERIPEASSEVVKRKSPKTLEPWMVGVYARALERGHTMASAADALGVSVTLVRKWLAEGDSDSASDLHKEFLAAARAARTKVVDSLIENAMNHAALDPKLCMDLLKVLSPDFNVARKVEAEVKTVETPRDFSKLSEDELRSYRETERKLLGGGS